MLSVINPLSWNPVIISINKKQSNYSSLDETKGRSKLSSTKASLTNRFSSSPISNFESLQWIYNKKTFVMKSNSKHKPCEKNCISFVDQNWGQWQSAPLVQIMLIWWHWEAGKKSDDLELLLWRIISMKSFNPARAVQYLFQSGSSFWLQICSVKTSFLSPENQSRKPIDPGSLLYLW
jgi:hypothetical protein